MGRVKRICFGEAGYIEGVEEPWLCVFHPKECLLAPNQKYSELYREGFLVIHIFYGIKLFVNTEFQKLVICRNCA